MRLPVSIVGALVLATGASAHSVTEEMGYGAQAPTPGTPSAGYFTNRLAGEVELNDAWSVRGEFLITDDRPSPSAAGASFGSSGGWIPLVTLGANVDLNDHWSLSVSVDGSPKSKQLNDAPIALGDGGIQDADLRSTTSALGGALSVGFETAGDSNWESSATGMFGINRYQTTQAIAAVATPQGVSTLTKLKAACVQARSLGRAPSWCAPMLGEPGDVTQMKLTADFTETLFEHTEVGVTGSYYLYDKDPTTVGYFTLASRGRITGGSNSFGEGLAIAPYQFTLRPSAAHALGPVRVELGYQYGQYVPGQGSSQSFSAKASVRFNAMWKAWASFWGERDVDGVGNVTQSSALSLGVRCHF